MAPRLQLHDIFKTFTDNVYFQPPENITLEYPCIIYQRDYAETDFADDISYTFTWRYVVTVIDRDPDSVIPEKVAKKPMCLYNRFFTADNLNHDVFRLFF